MQDGREGSATRHSWYSNWEPSICALLPSNSPTLASLLVGLPSTPGHVDEAVEVKITLLVGEKLFRNAIQSK